jgi:hypothetical protein
MSKKVIITILSISLFVILGSVLYIWRDSELKAYERWKEQNKQAELKKAELLSQAQYTKVYYKDNYAFDIRKSNDFVYYIFTNFDSHLKRNFLNLINDINNLHVDLQGIEKEYASFTDESFTIAKVTKIDSSFHRPMEVVDGSKLEEVLDKVKATLPQKYSEIEKYEYLSEEESKNNSFKGYYESIFLPLYAEKPVINIGGTFDARIRKDDLLDFINYLQTPGIEKGISSVEELTGLKPVKYDKLREIISSKQHRLYDISLIGNTPLSEKPDINEIGVDNDTTISTKSLAVEYLYIKENSTLVPLLRINGAFPSKYGEQSISFWIWFLDEY